jgi:type II secretory pathway pseudopilin PulG
MGTVRADKRADKTKSYRPLLSGTAAAGFTLVELIVSLLLFGLVIGMVVSVLTFSTGFLTNTQDREQDKQLAETAADFVKERLLYATSIEVFEATSLPPSSAASGDVLFIGSDPTTPSSTGQLYFMRQGDASAQNVFGEGYYANGQKLALDYDATVDSNPSPGTTVPPKSFTIKLTALRDDNPSRESTKTFSLYGVGADKPPTSESINSASSFGKTESAPFYLVIKAQETSTEGLGYAKYGLILHLDAIDNDGLGVHKTIADNATTYQWKDLSGKNNHMTLQFTGNADRLRDSSIYFDGDGDYGVITQLDLSPYSEVTVEVCFRYANLSPEVMPMLYEYSSNWNDYPTAFYAILQSGKDGAFLRGSVRTQFNRNITGITAQKFLRICYLWSAQDSKFTTHSNYFGMVNAEEAQDLWIDGADAAFSTYGTLASTGNATYTELLTMPTNSGSGNFLSHPFYLASRAGNSLLYKGEIASVRIYDHKLSQAEIDQNQLVDKLRFGTD